MRITQIMMIVVLILTLLIDFYIRKYIQKNSQNSRRNTLIYDITSVSLWIYIFIVMNLPRDNGEFSLIPIMWMVYTYITIYISKITFVIVSALMMIPRLFRKRIKRSALISIFASIIVFLILWWGAIIGRREIQVVRFAVESPKIPSGFNGYKIVQISDLHVGTWGKDTTFISKFVDEINYLKPNVIFFTGDIVNRNSSELKPFLNVLKRLKATDGIYSVMGNHDYGMYQKWDNLQLRDNDIEQLKLMQKKIGWTMLNNSTTFLKCNNDSIALIGVENWGEPPFGQYGDLNKACYVDNKQVINLNDSCYKILLTHNPEHWCKIVSKISNIDLTLSGHTHAMQFILGFGNYRWSPAKYKYTTWAGDYHTNAKDGTQMTLYVNIGAGEVGLPYRINAAPEITLITLKKI